MSRRKINSADWGPLANPLGFIRLILLVDWDPIGILGYTKAMDEYDSYAIEIYDLLISDASQEAVVAYLRQIEVELMAVRGNPKMALSAVAAKLRTVYHTAHADEN